MRRVFQVRHAVALLVENFAVLSQSHPASVAIKDLAHDLIFQALDVETYGRLCKVNLGRGLGKAACFNDSDKSSKLSCFEYHGLIVLPRRLL